ncbi:acyl-CoA dehydrogenase family protein [Sinobaca sp. H24]|uniref:acyl-CoA dehydrogenase family protein n=2 Tax=Sinobaca sp. H24 TaxID=2923376 RepID=UPI00207AAED6|nr:acyl-CoA dehydrogenase family protein [Sinobaca sp. H24]
MQHSTIKHPGGSFMTGSTSPDSIFVPEHMTEEHRMIAKTAERFIENDVLPVRNRIEEQDFTTTTNLLKKAGELGLLGHSIPESHGGLGMDKISKAVVGEAVGGTSSYGVAHSNHTCIATLPITYYGTDDQKRRYLPKLASGEYLGAYCLTEPNAGSDALASQTTAVWSEAKQSYLLNGTKLYITNAAFADTFIVYAKVDGEHFTSFIVEKTFAGLSLGPEEKKMGIKGSSTRSVVLEDCMVPRENLLGDVGQGHLIALNVLNLGRFNLGSACVGGAKAAFKKTVAFILERRQFGSRIADFTATKEKAGRLAARLYAAESIQYRTAGLLEDALGSLYTETDHHLINQQLREYAVECAICKIYGSETLDLVVDEALQLHGGAGFIEEYEIERAYRDSRINRIFEGTNEINRLLVPAPLFRRAAKGEIDLGTLARDAAQTLHQPQPTADGMLAPEQRAVEAIREMLLVCSGMALRRYGKEIKNEQETLISLADLSIQLYAAESTLLRTMAAVQKVKEAPRKKALTSVCLYTCLEKAERTARALILEIGEEQEKTALTEAIYKVCAVYQEARPVREALRFIADEQYVAGRYQG